MADNLPEPKSRKESYLAKAAGMDVTIPEAPESRIEQYLAAIAEGGGGGGTSDFDELTNRPKYNGTAMTGDTNIPLVENGAKQLTSADYDYPTDNPDGVALWLLDAGLYLNSSSAKIYRNKTNATTNNASYVIFKPANEYRADIIEVYGSGGKNTYTWYKTSPDGSGQNIEFVPYAHFLTEANMATTTGNDATKVMDQNATTSMVFADPGTNSKVRIGNTAFTGTNGIIIGKYAVGSGAYAVSIGSGTSGSAGPSATATGGIAIGQNARIEGGEGGGVGNYGIAIGYNSRVATAREGSIALGAWSKATEKGQMDISTLATTNTNGYNNSQYRLLTGLYDGQNAHDAVTLGQLNTRLDNLTLLKISQTDYDNLQNKDANTLYVITGA